MIDRKWLASAVVALALLVSLVPATTVSAACTDRAQFVSETVPDGTTFHTGQTFTKSWRIKNVGTCTWSTSYVLAFASGDRLNGPITRALTSSVLPNATVEFSVLLTAPDAAGIYRGEWWLKNASSTGFGLGTYANVPWWVQINVTGSGYTPHVGYDFATNASSATWTSQTGALTFPGADTDAAGGVRLVASGQKLENGTLDSGPALVVHPNPSSSGYIKGEYPAYDVQHGDHFRAYVGCKYGVNCAVEFRLEYRLSGSGTVNMIDYFDEAQDGRVGTWDVDVSGLEGQTVHFILKLIPTEFPADALAIWSNPVIYDHEGGTPPPPPPTPGPSGCTNRAQFVDETVPDGTVKTAGDTFTKTWRIRNAGSCTWTTGYKLVYNSGDQMAGASPIALTSSVAPGAIATLAVDLTAPATAGTHTGYWMLADASNHKFGLGWYANQAWWVSINVGGGGSSGGWPAWCSNLAAFVSDVTVPDGTSKTAGSAFVKTWRIRNAGTCTWTPSYHLVFVSGSQMGGAASTALADSVYPGESVDLSVNLTAPASAGTYTGYWMLDDGAGHQFGLGWHGYSAWWVQIAVTVPASSTPTATLAATATATNTSAPTATNTATATNTSAPTATNTATATATNTPAPTATNTATNTPSPTPTSTPSG